MIVMNAPRETQHKARHFLLDYALGIMCGSSIRAQCGRVAAPGLPRTSATALCGRVGSPGAAQNRSHTWAQNLSQA